MKEAILKPMMYEWSLTEKVWEELMADDAAVKHGEDICENPDTYGTCYIGILCAEIQHSLDVTDPYAYTNIYMMKADANYGTTPSGFNYDLLDDGPEVPMQCKSFEMFKHAFEENFTSYIARKHLEEAAAQPLADWN